MNLQTKNIPAAAPVNFGFLGAGQIAYSSADGIQKHPRGKVLAAQDLSPERLKTLCDEKKIPKSYATAEALLADPEIHVVYIAVPNKFHIPLTLQSLNAGKHVILEKPFAMNYREAKEAADLAKKKNLILTLGMNQRFNQSHQQTKALIEAGTLGDVYHAKAYWFRRRGIPKLGTWFGNRAMSGGGCLCDIGVHALDLCLYLLGNFKPVSVFGATYTKFGNRGMGEGTWGKSDRSEIPFDVEDFATGLVRFENGSTVTLDAAWACHNGTGSDFDVQLFGTEAGALASSCRLFRPQADGASYVTEDELSPKIRYPHRDRFHNFINHLTEGEELCVKLEEALVVQKILDGIAESARTGHEVRLDV